MDIKELLSNKLHKSDIEEIYGQIVKDDNFDKMLEIMRQSSI